ncbi:CBP80/20-dependent translation initiation factor isoform X1 [Tachysurus ichikawai]
MRVSVLSRWASSLGGCTPAPRVLACPSHPLLIRSCFSFRRQQRPSGGGGVGGGGGGGGGPKSHNLQQQHQQHQQVPSHSQQQHQPTNQMQQLIADPQSEGFNAKHGHGHGGRGYQSGQQGRGHHHGYSQNRRWHQQHRQPGQWNAKDTDSVKEDENEHKTSRAKDNAAGDYNKNNRKQEKTEGGKKFSLLQSSKDRLRRRLNEKEEVPVATPGPQRNLMDKLLEILTSMRSNSSGVEAQLASFMEEAQSSAQSEETLNEIVHTIYSKAVQDRGFAVTAAKLCYKMALSMAEGTKFRSLLLNMLQVCILASTKDIVSSPLVLFNTP